MAHPFFTIGHSTRPLEEFIALLNIAEVKALADVRKMPRSRTNPQFNAETLPGALDPISYCHIAALGGLRGHRRDAPPSPNDFWENKSFRNYADYAQTQAFQDGLAQLREIGHARTCAIMCAEAVWWRCHRRFIADYLLAAGETVFHILGPGRIEPAKLTPAARRTADGALIYARQSESAAATP